MQVIYGAPFILLSLIAFVCSPFPDYDCTHSAFW